MANSVTVRSSREQEPTSHSRRCEDHTSIRLYRCSAGLERVVRAERSPGGPGIRCWRWLCRASVQQLVPADLGPMREHALVDLGRARELVSLQGFQREAE